jgi:hypothetical protein
MKWWLKLVPRRRLAKRVLLWTGLLLIGLVGILMQYNLTRVDSIPLAALHRALGINRPSAGREVRARTIIGHRGSGTDLNGVENTIGAIRKAIEVGIRHVEVDVRRCRDELILFHDEPIERIILDAGRSELTGLTSLSSRN